MAKRALAHITVRWRVFSARDRGLEREIKCRMNARRRIAVAGVWCAGEVAEEATLARLDVGVGRGGPLVAPDAPDRWEPNGC